MLKDSLEVWLIKILRHLRNIVSFNDIIINFFLLFFDLARDITRSDRLSNATNIQLQEDLLLFVGELTNDLLAEELADLLQYILVNWEIHVAIPEVVLVDLGPDGLVHLCEDRAENVSTVFRVDILELVAAQYAEQSSHRIFIFYHHEIRFLAVRPSIILLDFLI